MDFLSGSVGKESAYNVGDLGLIPGLGRSPGRRSGNPLQYSCLENSMDRGAWRAIVHGVTKSWTRLCDGQFHFLKLFVPPAPLPMGFPRQECWSELPCPPPGDVPHPGIELGVPALQADCLPSEPPGHGILIPRSGIEPMLPAVKTWSLNHWTTREVG